MTQQAISYYQVQSPTRVISRNVTVPLSLEYTSNIVQPSMKGAVHTGLLSDPRDNDSFSSSQSGDSKWQQIYQSLAVCAQCANLTEPPKPIETQDGLIFNASYPVKRPTKKCALYWCLKTYGIPVNDDSTFIEIKQQRNNTSADQITFKDDQKVYSTMPNDTRQEPFLVDVTSSGKITEWMRSLLKWEDQNEKRNDPTKHQDLQKLNWLDIRSKACCEYDLSSNPKMLSTVPALALCDPSIVVIEQKFESIAAAMTAELQSAPQPNEPMTFIGHAQAVQTYQTTSEPDLFVHVQWAWLVLPIDLVLLALLLQIVTMAQTSRRKTAVWKSSALALFFHARGAQPGGARIMDDIIGMEDLASRMEVRLENTNLGWRLTEERQRVV